MGKNKKKHKVQNLAIAMPSVGVGTTGVSHADAGSHYGTVQRRVSKISPEALVYDPSDMSKTLDELEDAVTEGKYKSGLKVMDSVVVDRFIDYYLSMGEDITGVKDIHGMAKKFLSICKSYYEYAPDSQVPIPDATYDKLISKYLSYDGNIEPTGIIPKGSRTVKKAEIKYSLLHNNMDKSYAIRETDPIPEGVKESTTIEQFLLKVYTSLGLSPKTDEITVEISPKVDGVSVNGTVSGDLLIDPQTRGSESEAISIIGMNGLQITEGHTVDEEFGIQYELFVTKPDLGIASKLLKLDAPYVSCRHAASGILRRLCTAENDELLKCVSLYPIASSGLEGSYEERIDYLTNFGIVPKDMISREMITGNLKDLLEKIGKKFEYYGSTHVRSNLSYAIDGIVITVARDEYQQDLGRVGRTNKFQVALKFNPSNAIGVVDHIALDCGAKGYRTPQVYLAEPVYLDGVPYDHIPILSINLFNSLGLRYGSEVNVHRVGDVIPSISMVREGSGKKIDLPDVCPECGKKLTHLNSKLYCANATCRGNLVGIFSQFFDRLGMDGYGDSFSRMLVEQLGCESLGDVLALSDESFESANINTELAKGFTGALRTALNKSQDYEVLAAMGLQGIGVSRAKSILSKCPLKELINLDRIDCENLVASALGNGYDAVTDALRSDRFRKALRELQKYDIHITEDFSPKTRVGHTGKELSPRTVSLCRMLDFEVADGKAFDILITADMDSNSSKMEVAKRRKLPIYLEEDFINRYIKDSELSAKLTPIANNFVAAMVKSVAKFR